MKSLIVAIFTALGFIACKGLEKNRPAIVAAGFDWQGHRGCRGLMPENSLPAFLHALDFQAIKTLELDLAVSKDGHLVVSHEPWFNPAICTLPNGDSISRRDAERYLIYERTLTEIQGFDCGSKGNTRFPAQQRQRIYKPTLAEVVAAVRARLGGKDIRWNIEIKSQPDWDGIRTPAVAAFARLVVEELRHLGIEHQATVQSFDVRALQAVKKLDASITLALLIENANGFDYNIDQLGFQPNIYSPYYLLVNKKLVRQCHSKGIQLIPWTVNDVNSMRRLIRLGGLVRCGR